ncbi:MAG: hypothetical protein ACYDDE_09440 [bacterium]
MRREEMKLIIDEPKAVALDDSYSKRESNSDSGSHIPDNFYESKSASIFDDNFQGIAEAKDFVFKDTYSYKKRKFSGISENKSMFENDDINPATGFPMIGGMGGVDTDGNPCGFSDD